MEKGYTAEEYTFPVRIYLGRMEKILRTVTILWSAIIRALASFCLFAVNVEFLRIRGFFVARTEREQKGNEKNEKNCKTDEPGYDPGYAADPDRLRRQH